MNANAGDDSAFVQILLQSDVGASNDLFDALLDIETGRLDIHVASRDNVVAEANIA